MRFRLVFYDTDEPNKYEADARFEYFGDINAIWKLWFTLTKHLNEKHVEVFNLEGQKCAPEKGLAGMIDYNV